PNPPAFLTRNRWAKFLRFVLEVIVLSKKELRHAKVCEKLERLYFVQAAVGGAMPTVRRPYSTVRQPPVSEGLSLRYFCQPTPALASGRETRMPCYATPPTLRRHRRF
ncbi:MAG TPA: hypothetical protein PKD78_09055, partial [Saprospiraceae bacterium]|nr:hypothetical protein [Saprospiraceae bacterium]